VQSGTFSLPVIVILIFVAISVYNLCLFAIILFVCVCRLYLVFLMFTLYRTIPVSLDSRFFR
jgi:hypothetical protein